MVVVVVEPGNGGVDSMKRKKNHVNRGGRMGEGVF